MSAGNEGAKSAVRFDSGTRRMIDDLVDEFRQVLMEAADLGREYYGEITASIVFERGFAQKSDCGSRRRRVISQYKRT